MNKKISCDNPPYYPEYPGELATAYIPYQKWGDLYTPAQGVMCGTLFPDLHNAGFSQLAGEENMSPEQQDEYTMLCALVFACVDLNLYLDTHPCDSEAIDCYNNYSSELMQVKKAYEAMYGPLCNFGYSLGNDPWDWPDSPWPWER